MTILRIGMAFVFLYAAVASLINPQDYLHYFPSFMRVIVRDDVLTTSFSVLEVLLSGWMLFGKNAFLPAVAMSILLVAIVAVNWQLMPILFRNIGLLSGTIAIALHHFEDFHARLAKLGVR
jgi:hypothetical protein